MVEIPGYWTASGGCAVRIDTVRVGCGVNKEGELGWSVTYPVAGAGHQGVEVKYDFIPAAKALTLCAALMETDSRWPPPAWVNMTWPDLEMLARTGSEE